MRLPAGVDAPLPRQLSGALADRIDIAIPVERPSAEEMGAAPSSDSASVRERVIAARERQRHRTGGDRANADLAAEEIEIGAEVERLLADVTTAGGLSGRGRERVIRLARTLADLDRAASIAVEHLEEALTLRRREAR